MSGPASQIELEKQRNSYASGFNAQMAKHRALAIQAHATGVTCLDIGCGVGDVTIRLTETFRSIVGIDINPDSIERAKEIHPHPSIQYLCSTLERFEPDNRFDTIIAVDVLEHVESPVSVLKKLATHLTPGGTLISIVPNGQSLHRHIGIEMGVLASFDELQSHDFVVGHRRYYTACTLAEDIRAAGLKLEKTSGILLKPFPNQEMERLPAEYIDALYAVGTRFPDLCAELLAVIRIPEGV